MSVFLNCTQRDKRVKKSMSSISAASVAFVTIWVVLVESRPLKLSKCSADFDKDLAPVEGQITAYCAVDNPLETELY